MSLLPKQKCFDCDINGRLKSENRSLQVEVYELKQKIEKLQITIELIKSLPLLNGIYFEDLDNQYRETVERIKKAVQ